MERQRISWCNGESEISKSSMSGWSQTEIKTEMEIEEEFCAIVESIKSEDERNADIEPATLPEKYVVQRIEGRLESSELTQLSNNNVSLSLRCRLCAIPYNDMVDIFSSLETTDNILEKIEYSLPITVKDTDTLPKQICRFCSEELERCHRFRKTVAAAEEQLLAFEKLACVKWEETEQDNALSLLHNTQLGSTEYHNVDGPLETNSDIEMNDNESKIIPEDSRVAIRLQSCSVVLSILKTCSEENSSADNDERISSNAEDRNADLTTEVLDVERKASENDEENTCDSAVNTENPDDFTPAHSRNQLLRCKTCAQTFKWKSSLTRHSKIHQLQKCNTWAKTFKWKYNLPGHSEIHTNRGRQLHKCTTCAKTFKRKYDLTRHSEIHKNRGRQLHKCKTCAKTFKWKSDLTRHNKIHTGKGLHSCHYCEKAFTKKQVRDKHHRVHTNERPFKCPDCEKSFSLLVKLKQHTLVHLAKINYRCPLCDKSYSTLEDIRSHMREIHMNDRAYRCAHCGKTFGRKSSLRIHLETCKYQSD